MKFTNFYTSAKKTIKTENALRRGLKFAIINFILKCASDCKTGANIMSKGNYPFDYFSNPNINKPIEEIWADIDAFSMEVFPDEVKQSSLIDFFIPLPPLRYEGKVTKGVFLSQGVDYIYECYPDIGKIFVSSAFSMWTSYPWSKHADSYCICYDNPEREAWFRRTNPDRADKILIPLQDADYTNEYFMAPAWATPKDIDVLCVARLSQLKNLPVFARALKIYHQRYGKKLNAVLVTGTDGNEDFEKEEYRLMQEELGVVEDYMEIRPHVNYGDMPKLFSSAKLVVLPALLEGKNRVLQEAMACNTAVVAFKDLNKYSRGRSPIFYGGAESGLLVPEFSAESLADTIHWGIINNASFKPRRNYLKYCGRLNFINKLIDSIPYFRENLPEYTPGAIEKNAWVDLAMQDNYQLSFMDYLYGKNNTIQHFRICQDNSFIINFYYSRFEVQPSKPYPDFTKLDP